MGQMRASKGGQVQGLRIWSKGAGRSLFLVDGPRC